MSKEKDNDLKKEVVEEQPKSANNVAFELSFIDTKYDQFFRQIDDEFKNNPEKVTEEIARRMVYQRVLVGYVDEKKNNIVDFDPSKITAASVLKLKTDDEKNGFVLPAFTELFTRDNFLARPKETQLKEDTYLNWSLMHFSELLSAIKDDNSMFTDAILNLENPMSQTLITRLSARNSLENLEQIQSRINEVLVKNTLDNSDVDNFKLEEFLQKVVDKFKNIKRIYAFRYQFILVAGIGLAFEIEDIEYTYNQLLEISQMCKDMTTHDVAMWYNLSEYDIEENKKYQLIYDNNKFDIKKLDEEKEKVEDGK